MLRAFLRSKIHRATVTHVDIDDIIIAAYGYMDGAEMEGFTPRIVLCGEGNRIVEGK
jgi:aspartate 1-decarboxylase